MNLCDIIILKRGEKMTDKELAIYIGNKIKEYRKAKSFTQKELAEKVGMGDTTIANYEKGFRTPKKNTLFKLANAFDISIDDLFPLIDKIVEKPTTAVLQLDKDLKDPRHGQWVQYGNELLEEQKREKTVENSKNTVEIHEEQSEYKSDKIISMEEYRKRVPVNVDFATSAGTGVCQEDNLDMEVMFYEDELAEDYDNVGIVMGSSMEPVLKNGDYIFVKITTDIPNGAISIWQVNGENYVKKFRSNGRPYLESLNPEYDDVELDEDDNIRPLGVVVDVYREN